MVTLTIEASGKFSPKTYEALRKFISSVESWDGPTHVAWQDGPTIERSGPPAVRASRSRSPAKVPEQMTIGTYGPTFTDFTVPEGPLSLWESRLRARLAAIGSPECDLIWKEQVMSSGPSLSRLVPSRRRSSECAHGLWPAPTVNDQMQTAYSYDNGNRGIEPDSRVGPKLKTVASKALWPAPRASENENRTTTMAPSHGNGHGIVLAGLACDTARAMWPAPTAGLHNSSESPEQWRARQAKLKEKGINGNGAGVPLAIAAKEAAFWAAPLASNARSGKVSEETFSKNSRPLQEQAVTFGAALSGSSAPMESSGVLSPELPCWLMGYDLKTWLGNSPGLVTPSTHGSRKKSSKRGSKRTRQGDMR